MSLTGIKHYLILGGDPETFSYAEFLYDENKNPAWVGGYFTSGKVGETITASFAITPSESGPAASFTPHPAMQTTASVTASVFISALKGKKGRWNVCVFFTIMS